MRSQETLDRYRLLELVAEDGPGIALWHAYDEVLDRPVSIRVIPLSDPRLASVLAAAQAAALIDDRRLLRVLDIIDIPAAEDSPEGPGGACQGIVSEWASGRTLEQALLERNGTPFAAAEALGLVADIARAVAAGASEGVCHGRLRPSSVFITDAGEVRVRGLAVDAAVFGNEPLSDGSTSATPALVDVDALGCLTYLLSTGYWAGTLPVQAEGAPRVGNVVLPPSQVRAAVPGGIDDLVARSVASAAAHRGWDPIPDASGFAAAAGAALDHVAPVSTTTLRPVVVGPVTTGRRILGLTFRIVATVAAIGLVYGIAWSGWQLLTSPPAEKASDAETLAQLLTSPAKPVDDLVATGFDQPFPIVGFRSYDPYGDDDGNGKTDKRKGRENEELAATVNDEDPDTAWLTSEYGSADLDGKGGVGLIIDLGEEQEIQQVSVNLVGRGTGLDVRVSDGIQRDPALWTPLGMAFAPQDRVDVRAPRPVPGRYVLLWLTKVPPVEGTGSYQGGVRSVVISG